MKILKVKEYVSSQQFATASFDEKNKLLMEAFERFLTSYVNSRTVILNRNEAGCFVTKLRNKAGDADDLMLIAADIYHELAIMVAKNHLQQIVVKELSLTSVIINTENPELKQRGIVASLKFIK